MNPFPKSGGAWFASCLQSKAYIGKTKLTVMPIKLMTLCMALCCLFFEAIAQNLPDYVSSDGLMGWYEMDGNALDFSSNQSNGSIDGAVAGVNRLDETDSALTFGMGASESISRMILPGLVTDVSNSFSVAFWGKPTESVNFPIQGQTGNEIPPNGQVAIHAIHGTHFGPDSAHAGFGLALATNGLSLIEHSDAWQTAPIVIQEDLSAWHHYAVVYADGVSSVYIDGAWAASGLESNRSIHISFGTDPWYPSGGIGHGYHNRRYFGQLDDMGFWSRSLSEMEVNSLFLEQLLIFGCTDESACNFNAEANNADNSCIYPLFGEDCETGAAACGEGTEWDVTVQACVVSDFCQEDLDGDGAIGVTDLMQLLSLFGTDCPIWMCGDPVNYDGYDYATVQIGNQCWFAENLRTEHYANGDAIPGELSDSEWSNADSNNLGAQAIHTSNPANLAYYGRLYNWYAVDDERGLCLAGWHVPTDGELMTLEMELGMSESEANGVNARGSDQGTQLKSSPDDSPSWNGTNTSGFSSLAGGVRYADGSFYLLTSHVYFWSASLNGEYAWYRNLHTYNSEVSRNYFDHRGGFSVRCVRD